MLNGCVPVVSVFRGPLVESVHAGAIAVVRADGRPIASLGDPELVTFARSAAKPLQAVAVVEAGAADRFDDAELALLCASHSGEPVHTAAVETMLAKLCLSAEALRCGGHEPYDAAAAAALRRLALAPTALHDNCSGKHAGMLALALRLHAPTDSYTLPGHPVQQLMLQTVAAMADIAPEAVALGVDGCGAPVFGLPLRRLALAYARFGAPEAAGLPHARAAACSALAEAIARHPRMLAGTGRYDTRLIAATGGRLLGKMGAEGVFAVAVRGSGIGIAVKVADGGMRALYPTVTETLRQLDLLAPYELAELRDTLEPDVTNRQGDIVGRIVPRFRLERA